MIIYAPTFTEKTKRRSNLWFGSRFFEIKELSLISNQMFNGALKYVKKG